MAGGLGVGGDGEAQGVAGAGGLLEQRAGHARQHGAAARERPPAEVEGERRHERRRGADEGERGHRPGGEDGLGVHGRAQVAGALQQRLGWVGEGPWQSRTGNARC